MKITLIGAGNVATHLALALKIAGHEIDAVVSRTSLSANKLADRLNNTMQADGTCTGVCNDSALTKAFTIEDFKGNDSDIFLISVKDDAVRELAQRLVPLAPNALWVHTAGSLPMDIIEAEHVGVFYPMQTFSIDKHVDMTKVSLFIESKTCEEELLELARSITEHVYRLDSEGRRHLHLAAVFACNFANHCFALSETLLKEQGLPFKVMLPLIDETADKAHAMSPIDGQTGPAVRGDEGIMDSQLELLADKPIYAEIYRLMSKSIQTLSNNNR